MIRVPTDKHGNVGWVVRANKPHRCEMRNAGCTGIAKGDRYYRAMAWPNSDVNHSEQPWVLRVCRACLHDEHRALFDSVAGSSERGPDA